MMELPPREALAALARAAGAVAPSKILGFTRPAGDTSISVLYVSEYGIGGYIVDAASTPDYMSPAVDGLQHADAGTLAANASRPIEWHLQSSGVQQVVSMPVRPDARFWVGFGETQVPADDLVAGFATLADQSAALLSMAATPDDEIARLRRLDMTAELLPALVRVLDVREVFDRVSAISKAALPHDVLTIGLFSDDYSTLTLYADSTHGPELGAVVRQPYPAAFTSAFDFDILDDRANHPLERDRPVTRMGVRSSLRLSIRIGGRVIGGLGFNSLEPSRYNDVDVAVARRLADHVGVALSHQALAERLAEQARRTEELHARAEKSDLLDEVLASVTEAGTLPEVFDRVSNATQKVLAHDALLLASRLPDGKHAKVYAGKTRDNVKFPDVIEVPPFLLANPNWEFDIVDDLQADPAQRHLWTAQHGYRSTLRVPIRFANEFVGGVSFVSFTPGYYGQADVPVARRIAERIALSFARERGAALMKRADEASARASRLESRVQALTEELDARTGYRRVVGQSQEWRQVLTQATQVSATEATVLLLGESGTGKEVVARFLHRASPRTAGPFVALNCAALPEHLLEAELFGYERGAFTGAVQSKPGQLEQAAGGTLFLDEVGEMSPAAQAKFLRVLQEKEFQRLGGTRVLRTDARVVAATNRDLPRAISQGQFREDLYYRLNVFAIRLPPLRDRRNDVVPLSEAFLAEICRGLGRPPSGISRDARTMLIDYHWPGNVRELRNILERAAILCDGGLITAEHLALNVVAPVAPAAPVAPMAAVPVVSTPPAAARPASTRDLQSVEREMIEQALQGARFNKSKAAKALGLSRQKLYLRMRKYGLE